MRYCFLLFAAVLFGGEPSGREYRWIEHTFEHAASLRGISVLNDQVVWTTGSEGAIYKTENGGQTWERMTIPDTELLDFRDVEVLSIDEIVVMSAGAGDKSRIFKTADGGKSWTQVYENTFEQGFFDGIAFWNEKEGILGSDPVNDEMYFLKTVDGGDSWRRIDPGLLPALNEGESGGFAASGSHLAVNGNSVWISSAFSGSRVTWSNDKGATWNVVSTPMIQGSQSQGIFSLAFFDEKTGVAVGGDYSKEAAGTDNVMRTEDGGRSWQLTEDFPLFQSAVRYLGWDKLISVGPKAG